MMRYISTPDWMAYIRRLSALNETAAQKMMVYVRKQGFGDIDALIRYAYGLATKYGEGAAALAAEMHDAVAALEKAACPPAEPAATAGYQTVAKTVQGVAKQSHNENMMGNAIGRLVKQAGADTALKNALRDGAEFAWIPVGDSCPFCITLASRGWQKASKDAIKNGHAEHIHANCDCTYAVRFRPDTSVRGYDPAGYYQRIKAVEGKNAKERLNALRRKFYAKNREIILEQKKEAYKKRQAEQTE